MAGTEPTPEPCGAGHVGHRCFRAGPHPGGHVCRCGYVWPGWSDEQRAAQRHEAAAGAPVDPVGDLEPRPHTATVARSLAAIDLLRRLASEGTTSIRRDPAGAYLRVGALSLTDADVALLAGLADKETP